MSGARHSSRATQSRDARPVFVPLALALLTLAIYAQTGAFAFVNFDDDLYVYNNPAVMSGVSVAGALRAFASTDPYYWHPLTMLSHALDWTLYGQNAGGHHITNVALHALGAVLLFFALRELTGAVWRSAAVAALFTVHPLHVESVAWVSERKDVLCSVFWFAAMLAYARYVKRRTWGGYGLIALCFALALMSKPMAVTLPLALLILDAWPLRRWGASTARELILEKLPLFAIAAAVSVITYLTQVRYGADQLLGGLSAGARVSNAVTAYATYLGKTVWPRSLSVLYPYRGDLSLWEVAGSAIVLAGITGFVWEMRRRAPYLAAGWVWFLVVLAPASGIIQVGYQAYADRFVYIPHVGLFAAVVWGVEDIAQGRRFPHAVMAGTAGAVILCLAWVAFLQTRHWRDGVSLFSHAVSVTRDNYVAHTLLGYALQHSGRRGEAEEQFRDAIRINPGYATAHNNLGTVLAEQGRVAESVGNFDAAVRLMPGFCSARYNLAMALLKTDQSTEALHAIDAALACPVSGEARESLEAAKKQLLSR